MKSHGLVENQDPGRENDLPENLDCCSSGCGWQLESGGIDLMDTCTYLRCCF